jgi:hypothetical protein
MNIYKLVLLALLNIFLIVTSSSEVFPCTAANLLRTGASYGYAGLPYQRWLDPAGIPAGWSNSPDGNYDLSLSNAIAQWEGAHNLLNFTDAGNIQFTSIATGSLGQVWPSHDINTGYLDDCLMEINSDYKNQFSFGCVDDPNKYCLESVLIHELGHVLGFKDTPGNVCTNYQSVMDSTLSITETHCALRTVDEEALEILYPCPETEQMLAKITSGQKIDMRTITCDRPVAKVSDFRVESGYAKWTVIHEFNTKEYILQGCSDVNGIGIDIISDEPGYGEHSLKLPANKYPIVSCQHE